MCQLRVDSVHFQLKIMNKSQHRCNNQHVITPNQFNITPPYQMMKVKRV